ncbi:hypothetical protein BpHYR1_016743 [Brachionus plicatilis]|uniref:Uncharacterized protein n=1 Tax=Brachionus plicatilis TaxID=10195 RepID=A0A3M7Q173_BRAPC|nr:hypothetical protein BpHYR1_016743 [Brachionus plicatilis]
METKNGSRQVITRRSSSDARTSRRDHTRYQARHTVSPSPLIFSSGLGTKVTYGTFIINSATHPST